MLAWKEYSQSTYFYKCKTVTIQGYSRKQIKVTFQYLNSGAGGIAGGFLHSRYVDNPPTHYHGWFGNRQNTR